ncbi:hypothetical protein RJ641_014677 [Dillenia turbinata]|uniref:Uncharacterized protein n=1 Tax=Dillenia turbinata TaxID=194707 RepID=A0AAN8YZL1_9MAGN
MEAEHVLKSIPGKQLGSDAHSDLAANVKDGDLSDTMKLKRSSSSSASLSESDFKDPLNDDIYESDSSMTDLPQIVEHQQLASQSGAGSSTSHHDGLPVSSLPTDTPGYVSYSLPTQTPSVQVMEHPPGYDENRIPSSVFARTNTSAPVEWSSASNESLFSIHPGNMSFTRDYLILLQKSEELGTGEFMIPSPLISLPGGNSNTCANPGSTLDTSSAASETMKEVLKENTKNQGDYKFSPEEPQHSPSMSPHSDGSPASCKSFAFPVLSQGEKNSLKVQSPKHNPMPNSQPETPTISEAAATTKAASNDAAQHRWYTCFCCPSCCPSCSS